MESVRTHDLPRPFALVLFALVILCWGGNWAITKIVVHQLPPLWATTIRCSIASVVLFFILLLRRQLIVPKARDFPVIAAVGLLHMVAFSTLVAFGLKYVPLGRSIVLGYTTPLWVVPGASLFLGEKIRRPQMLGCALGLIGLLAMFNPGSFNFHDLNSLIGNGALLLAAFCWAATILYVRAHRWVATPFQLVFWQTLLAAVVLAPLAFWLDGPPPDINWSPGLITALLYAGVIGTALAYWAMAMINRSLDATTTSLGLLATPVVGVACSAIGFNEAIDTTLVIAMALILGGILVGTCIKAKQP